MRWTAKELFSHGASTEWVVEPGRLAIASVGTVELVRHVADQAWGKISELVPLTLEVERSRTDDVGRVVMVTGFSFEESETMMILEIVEKTFGTSLDKSEV